MINRRQEITEAWENMYAWQEKALYYATRGNIGIADEWLERVRETRSKLLKLQI